MPLNPSSDNHRCAAPVVMSRTKSQESASISHNFFSPKVSNPKSNSIAALILAEISFELPMFLLPDLTGLLCVASVCASVATTGCQSSRSAASKAPAQFPTQLGSNDVSLAPNVLFASRFEVLADGLPLVVAQCEFSDEGLDKSGFIFGARSQLRSCTDPDEPSPSKKRRDDDASIASLAAPFSLSNFN